MLFLSVSHPDIPKHIEYQIDGIELRLDLFHWEFEKVKYLLDRSPHPVMLTLRKKSQGGKFEGTEEEREAVILKLLALQPPFFDLEGDMRPTFLENTIKKFPKTKFVLSHHDFEKTPENLESIYQNFMRFHPFSCKIAAFANATNDALKMLLFAKNHRNVSVICMGEKGEFARVLGKIAGNVIDYAVFEGQEKTGPGQLTAEELISIYRYPTLNEKTAIYGLIGNPVVKSPGHIHHNGVFREKNVNAVYVKMIVNPEELEEFLNLAKQLSFHGLSVTIPLKGKIVPFVDHIDPKTKQIGAINTLRFEKNQLFGTNTDGVGALDAIESQLKVKGKEIVLIGAGGAARGIAFEALARGAHLTILNRTLERAKELAKEVNGKAGALCDVPKDADILINCSPDPIPINPKQITGHMLVMDIVYAPKETEFLKVALQKGCKIVYGEEMFYNQAQEQTRVWLSDIVD
ncbi:MAG: shikimate dehydrogenase [Chlamydiae bacterium]|nr:shikimate dehydrogenase [Chlamydiota bacterium]